MLLKWTDSNWLVRQPLQERDDITGYVNETHTAKCEDCVFCEFFVCIPVKE